MRDFWRWNGRSHILFRVWWPRRFGRTLELWILHLLWSLYRVLLDQIEGLRWSGTEVSLKSWPKMNGFCYCQNGSSTDLRIVSAQFGLWLSVGRYRGAIPCPCDIKIHELVHIPEGRLDCNCPASPLWSRKVDVRRDLELAGLM